VPPAKQLMPADSQQMQADRYGAGENASRAHSL
jgi:hypothetical protein